jgi:hypothetical protein
MKTVVFEVGLLGFFVSAVVFVAQGTNLFDTVARAFIVFIGIELAATLVLAMIMSRSPEATTDVHQNGEAVDGAKRRGPAVQAKA